MRVVVGLGNPGTTYRYTRHNAGFMVLDHLAEGGCGLTAVYRGSEGKNPFAKTRGPFLSLEGELSGVPFLLVKPATFMNESGRAVASLVTRGNIHDPGDLLVVLDDVDLGLGRLRFRERGSAGGHNGLKSIIEAFGTEEFARLRIGTGPRPGGDEMVDYVLSSFRPEEFEMLNQSIVCASRCVEAWITGGIERAKEELSKPGNAP